MPYIEQMNSGYVKFIRGTLAAWESLSKKDPNTLYFISSADSSIWKLYLGDRLISDGSAATATSIADLTDIILSEGSIVNNSLLVYDATEGVWTDKTAEDVIADAIEDMVGASDEADGTHGLVPAPKKGEQNLYLRGDGTWANPASDINSRIDSILDVLYDEDDKTQSIHDIASGLIKDLIGAAPEELDTLQEIADWISKHEDAIDLADIKADIKTLNDTVFGIESSIDDDGNEIPEVLGLVDKVGTLETNYITINNLVQTLDERMRWYDLTEVTTTE